MTVDTEDTEDTGNRDRIGVGDEVAEGLRELHALLRKTDTTAEKRAELQRRLIALASSSKHDLPTAARRLPALRAAITAADSAKSPARKGETPPR